MTYFIRLAKLSQWISFYNEQHTHNLAQIGEPSKKTLAKVGIFSQQERGEGDSNQRRSLIFFCLVGPHYCHGPSLAIPQLDLPGREPQTVFIPVMKHVLKSTGW